MLSYLLLRGASVLHDGFGVVWQSVIENDVVFLATIFQSAVIIFPGPHSSKSMFSSNKMKTFIFSREHELPKSLEIFFVVFKDINDI